MENKKKSLIALLALASFALAGCSGDNTPSSSSSNSGDSSSSSGTSQSGDSSSASDSSSSSDSASTSESSDISSSDSSDSSDTSGSSEEDTVDKTALDAKIAEVEEAYPSNPGYTTASFEALMAALEAAKAVSADANATQEQVDEALANLIAAIDGLAVISLSKESLRNALNADYTDSTIECEVVTDAGDGESYYFSIYNKGGYNAVVYEANGEAYTDYFYEYEGVSYQYWKRTVNGVEKEAWIHDGYEGIEYGLEDIFFSWKYSLRGLSYDEVTISATMGAYYFNDSYLATAENLLFGSTNLMIPSENAIQAISVELDNDGNVYRIIGFYDDEGNDYVRLTFSDIGSTADVTVNAPAAPTEETITDYYTFMEEERHTHVGVASLTLSHTEEAKASYKPEESFNLYLDIVGEEGFDINMDFDSYIVEQHVSDESIISVSWDFSDASRPNSRTFLVTPMSEGTATFYVTYQNVYGDKTLVTSNEITVVVKAAEETITDPKVYDLSFTSIDVSMSENQTLGAVNTLNNNKPFTVTGSFLQLYNLSYTDNVDFSTSGYAVALDPSNSAKMNSEEEVAIAFSFGKQEVSSIALNAGLFWESDYGNISYLSQFEIQTRASDTEAWTTTNDLLSFFKENVTRNHTTLIEASFEPTSEVRIVADASMIGHSIRPAFESVRFYANSDCNDYTITEKITLTSVAIAESYSVDVGSSITINATPIPSDATDVSYVYEVADTTIASVSGNVITGLKEGTTTIKVTATQDDLSLEATATLTVNKAYVTLTGVHFPEDSQEIEFDYEASYSILTPVLEPADAEDVTLAYSSSDTSIAIVSSDGSISAYKVGTVTITVTATQGELSFSDTIELTVKETLPAEVDSELVGRYYGSYASSSLIDITINSDSTLSLTYEGTTYTATFSEATAKNSYLFYGDENYEDIEITKVTSDTIWVYSSALSIAYDAYEDEPISRYVVEESVILSTSDFSLEVGGSKQVSANVQPYSATIRTVTWTSSNTAVATVTDGLVVAVAEGTATITATTASGLTASLTVTVTAPATTEDGAPEEYRGTSWSGNEYYLSDYACSYDVTFEFSADGKTAVFSINDYVDLGYSEELAYNVQLTYVRSVDANGSTDLYFTDANGLEFILRMEASSAYVIYETEEYAFDYDTASGMSSYLSQN